MRATGDSQLAIGADGRRFERIEAARVWGTCGVVAGDVPASPAVLMAPIASKSSYEEEEEGPQKLGGRLK